MKRRKRKKVRRIAFTVINIAIPLAIILFVWTYSVEGKGRFAPNYPQVEIEAYLKKPKLTEADYNLLFRQTGLSQTAIDTLKREGRTDEILAAQERFFREVDVECERNFLVFREVLKAEEAPGKRMRVADEVIRAIPVLENGDILITFSSHFLGWRNGHAALVVDAENGLTLEALTLGRDSAILSVRGWLDRPSFAVLRLTAVPKEDRAVIADYAERNLKQLPYRLTAGVWDSEVWRNITGGRDDTMPKGKVDEAITGTHCAHLIWYAYNHFGYDLDSDGGILVTPKDLFDSPLLEVVQVYGMRIE